MWVGKRKDQFDCTQCGDCCKTFFVIPKEQDIQRIEKHGYKRSNFMNGNRLKRMKDGSCIFLERRRKKYFCKIHKFRPDVCRRWPFAEYLGGRIAFGSSGRLKCEAIENMNPPKLIPISSIKFKK
ncbi:MAG: YkgJ family cysteine cluster protein [Candidatus Aenigmarchaeota archaeon]|nr:YkgJ family cysteine cluster protein [Candidatus Aenigmarchaeota archaeon]